MHVFTTKSINKPFRGASLPPRVVEIPENGHPKTVRRQWSSSSVGWDEFLFLFDNRKIKWANIQRICANPCGGRPKRAKVLRAAVRGRVECHLSLAVNAPSATGWVYRF